MIVGDASVSGVICAAIRLDRESAGDTARDSMRRQDEGRHPVKNTQRATSSHPEPIRLFDAMISLPSFRSGGLIPIHDYRAIYGK